LGLLKTRLYKLWLPKIRKLFGTTPHGILAYAFHSSWTISYSWEEEKINKRVKCTVGTWTCSAVSNRSINSETGYLGPRTCEPVHPRSSPVLHGLHGTVRPRFATVNPDLLQLPRFCFFFSNLFRLNLWKIITLRYDIGWRWFLYENYSPRWDLQLSSFEFFHLMMLRCSKKLYKITAP